MASVVGCELVTSTTRLPLRRNLLQKRFRARQKIRRAPASRASGAGMSSSSSRVQYSMQYHCRVCATLLKLGPQSALRFRFAEALGGGIAARNQGQPKPIVEAQVEQRAVHVEQHGIDCHPVDCSGRLHLRMIPRCEIYPPWPKNLMPIVERAGAAIMQVYDGAFAVQRKDDNSPLTLADLESQRVIIEGLQANHPARFRFCPRNRRRRRGRERQHLARTMGGRSARRHARVRQAQRRIHRQHRAGRGARAGARRGGRPGSRIDLLGCNGRRRLQHASAAASARHSHRPAAAARCASSAAARMPAPQTAAYLAALRSACRDRRWAAR